MKTYDELLALIEQRGVHPVLGAIGENWDIEQTPSELATFLARMQELEVTSVLEIGTGYRGGLSRFLAADMGWTVTTIDKVKYDLHYDGVTYLVNPDGLDGTFDLVFIDGAHSHDEAVADYRKWGTYATKVVAFHDIAGLRDCEGVAEFWHELAYAKTKLRKGYHEAIAKGDQRSGIGWIEL